MDVSVQIALIGFASSLAVIVVNSALRRWEKRAEYAWQSAIATEAKKGTDDLIAGQKKAAELLVENTKITEDATADTKRELQKVHTLVNSDKTDAKRELLEAYTAQLAFMEELMEFKQASGHPPSAEVLAATGILKGKIEALKVAIEERDKLAVTIELERAVKSAPVLPLPEVPRPNKNVDPIFDEVLDTRGRRLE